MHPLHFLKRIILKLLRVFQTKEKLSWQNRIKFQRPKKLMKVIRMLKGEVWEWEGFILLFERISTLGTWKSVSL